MSNNKVKLLMKVVKVDKIGGINKIGGGIKYKGILI